MDKDAKRLFDKITLNCFYTPYYDKDFFTFFDASIAEEITEQGRNLLNELSKKYEKEHF